MFKLLVFNERWCAGGVEALWANLLAHMPDVECEIVLLVGQKETNIYDDLLSKKNIRMVVMQRERLSNPIIRNIKIMGGLKKQFKKEKADIIHINACNAIGLKYAKIARKSGCKNIIVHSHNTRIENDPFKIKLIAHHFMQIIYSNKYICRMACSTEAGRFLFGKNSDFRLLHNGIDIGRFLFKENIRNEMRKSYNLDNQDIVYCHVGRFVEQKNHIYLIKLFYEIHKRNPHTRLILIGDGPDFNKINELVQKLSLDDSVVFLGVVKNVEKYYFMSDVFLLPSLHEGLPVVAIEAQATGLMCFLSDSISHEAAITRNCEFFSLKEDIDETAKKILESRYDSSMRTSVKSDIEKNGYSISEVSSNIFMLYKHETN